LIDAIVSRYSISVPKTHHSAIVMVPPDAQPDDALHRRARQMLPHRRAERDSIEPAIILTRMVQSAMPRAL
jgi:hypothetical protein